MRLEKIQRNFLWGGGALERKIHQENWKTVCLSKDRGGLEICDFLNLIRALRGKWNFSVEKNTLWKVLIRKNMGIRRGGGEGFTQAPGNSLRVSLWKEIRKEVVQLKLNSEFVVGEGSVVRFWEDAWCSPNPLCDSFLVLTLFLHWLKRAKGGWGLRSFEEGRVSGTHDL